MTLDATVVPPSIATDPGRTLATAYDFGVLNAEQNVTEFVGTVDAEDIYKFTLNQTSRVNIGLAALNDQSYQAYLDMELIVDRNGNGLIDYDDDLYHSDTKGFVNKENANITSTLGAYTYFVRVKRDNDNTNTDYNLTLDATVDLHAEPDPRTVDLTVPDDKEEDNVDIDNEIIDLNPLKVEVIDGEFTYNEETLRFETEGTIQIGLTNGVFPLATLKGKASYKENQDFEASGLLSASIGNLNLPLFDEEFKINIGKSTTSFLTDTTQNAIDNFNIPGTEIEFTAIDFTTEGLALEGNLQLPEVFGNAKIALEEENRLLIDENGVNFTGLTAEFPDINFKLFNSDLLELEATDLYAEYKHSPESERGLTLQGKVVLPQLFNATADFSGNNYIRINSEGKLDFAGSLSVKDVYILEQNGNKPNWGVKEAELKFETDEGELQRIDASATVYLPQKLQISGNIGFAKNQDEWKLNNLGVGASGLNMPIGSTGAYLQDISGSVANLANPIETEFRGTTKITGGGEIDFKYSLLDWEIGYEGSIISFDVDGGFNKDSLDSRGTIEVLGGLLSGGEDGGGVASASVGVNFNWNEGYIKADGTFNLLAGLISTEQELNINSNFDVFIAGSSTVKMPEFDTGLDVNLSWDPDDFNISWDRNEAGIRLVDTEVGSSVLRYTNNGDISDDFVYAWGTVPGIGKLGFTATFEKQKRFIFWGEEITVLSVKPIGSNTIKSLDEYIGESSSNSLSLSNEQLLAFQAENDLITLDLDDNVTQINLNSSVENTFPVARNTPWLALAASWENENDNVAIELVAPDGTIYTEADIANTANITIVEELTDSTHKIINIQNPDAGNWTIKLPDSNGLGNVEFAALGGIQEGSINIRSLEQNTDSNTVTINYEASDIDSEAQISFFYDNDNQGYDGLLIPQTAVEADGSGSFTWNTDGVATGEYYIYAMLTDGESIPVFDYSEQTVEITAEADLAVEQIANFESVEAGGDFTYKIEVTNNGAIASQGVTVTTTLPESVIYNSASIDPTSVAINELIFGLEDIAAGQSKTIEIQVTAPDTTGDISSRTVVNSQTFDPDTNNNIVLHDISVEEESIINADFATVDEPEPDNLPYVSNPITDITVEENAADRTIALSNVFKDADGDEITLAIKTNSNSQLVSASLNGTNLILDFAKDLYGTSDIAVEATANGEKVSDIFTVSVNEVIEQPQLALADVHRFYQYEKGFHLYTADTNEIAVIKDKSSSGELKYNYESEKYKVLAENKDTVTGKEIEGVEPIYRFFNTQTGAHLYTMDENEKSYIQGNLANYSFEGIKYYAFESEPENMNTIPVYRMLNTSSGAHLFSSDSNEIAYIEKNLSHFSMENNGNAAFHVFEL